MMTVSSPVSAPPQLLWGNPFSQIGDKLAHVSLFVDLALLASSALVKRKKAKAPQTTK